jgi:cytochrome c556
MTRIQSACAALATAVAATTLMAFSAGAHSEHDAAVPGDPVSLRQHMMMNVGAAMGMAGKMAKGETPYDAAIAEAAFRIMNTAALGYPAHFPEGSLTDVSEAGPKIWTDSAGWDAVSAKFIADTETAVKAKPADLEAFRPVFGMVAANCKACHQDYRVKKN